MMKKKSFNGRVFDMWATGMYYETSLMLISILLVLLAPLSNLIIQLGIVAFIFISLYIFVRGLYVKPIKQFALSYVGVEPISDETNAFLDKIGEDILKYGKPLHDREYLVTVE